MNKWRLLLFSIFALLHITTSERDFIDGRHGCYDHSPRYLPSDTKLIVYETNRESRFSSQIRQLNSPDKYPIYNVRNIEIIRLSRQRQINSIKQPSLDIRKIDGLRRNRILTTSADLVADNVRNTGTVRLYRQRQINFIKQRSLDNEIRQINGVRNRILTTPADQVEDKREDTGRNFLKSIYKRSYDLRTTLHHNRFAGDRDTEYQRRGRTTSLSRDNYRINYATTTRFNNRDVSDMRNTQNDNRVEARRIVSEDNEPNTRRYGNRNDIRNSFGYARYIETYEYEYPQKYASERVFREEPDLRNLRTTRSERTNNKLSNDRNSRFGIQRDLYQNLSQRVSRNGQRNNRRSLDRVDFRDNERRFLSDSQTNRRSLVRDIENLNSLNDNRKRFAGEHKRAVNFVEANREHILTLRETFKVPRIQSNRRQSFDKLDINDERENRFRTSRSSTKETYILRDDRNNARSTKDTRKFSENRIDMNERKRIMSRSDRRTVNYDARDTRNDRMFNDKVTSENRQERDVELKFNRIRMNSRVQMYERDTLESRVDRRNVNYDTRFTRNTNEKESSENREVRNNAELKTNRIRMNSRVQMNEQDTLESRVDRRNVNYDTRFTRNTNEKESSENREVRNNAELKINQIRMNSRMQMNEREPLESRVNRRNVNNNARSIRNFNEKETSENRQERDNAELKINRIRMNSRMQMNEREPLDSRVNRRNVNNNARSIRNFNAKETSENRQERDNAELKINRVRVSSRITLMEREPLLSGVDKRNVNDNARSIRNIFERETLENREVRDNAELKTNLIRINSRMQINERETLVSRMDRRTVNYDTRFTRNTNEKETSENREVRDNLALKVNSMYPRIEMTTRATRRINRNMIIIRRSTVERDLDTRIVRRDIPIQEFRVNELRQSERINDETRQILKRTREAIILSTENRERYESRRNLRELRYVRSREYRIEQDNRQRSGRHEVSTDKLHINNIQDRVENRLSAQQDENSITSRKSGKIDNIARGSIETSRRTVENDNRQWSRNVHYENRLSNKRHEARNARDEKRQIKLSGGEASIGIRRLAMARNEDKERPVLLHYENQVMEMKWQYLFYALQAVYICSIIMKISKHNEQNKSKMWIASWFTLTEHVKFD